MSKERYFLLDGIRGLTLLGMVAYHGMYDLVEIYGVRVRWFLGLPGYVWQQSICWTFILLSGFCWSMGHRQFRRGAEISLFGLVITAVTCVFMPSERIIFGILTFIGAAMLSMIPLSGMLKKIPAWAGILGSAALFFLTRDVNSGFWGFEGLTLGRVSETLYQGWLLTFFGFPMPGFFSGDYFSFFPWFFLYLTGFFLYRAVMPLKTARSLLCRRMGILEWVGKHTLPIYMVHQPILMMVLELVF